MKHNVRIVNDSIDPMKTIITDAETGQPIHGIRAIDLHIGFDEPVTATIEVLAEIDVVAEAEINRVRLNGVTGAYEPIEGGT